ncbi:MAG: ATP-binding cassette domain-containing protein, partial [Alcanivoracaceae bacterium]
DSQDRVADVGAYVGETLSQIRIVQAYNHEPVDRRFFARVAENAFDVARLRIRQRALLIAVVITLVLGAVGMMLWVGGSDVIAGRITGGELAAFVFYSIIVGSAVASISEVIGELQRAAGAAERLDELLHAQALVQAPAQPRVFQGPVAGALSLEGVCYAYPSAPGLNALDQLDLTVHAGETLALVGPSGAGKTTLFDLLLRFFDPQQGRICIDGIDIRDMTPATLRACFALVPQHPVLFFGTVADNLRYGRPEATDDEVHEAARVANADDFIRALPQGYDTRLGDGGTGLSGGQRQRLAIARAVLSGAPVLLLDEATSALDAHSESLVQQALERVMQDRTTLVIAHRLATVRDADRIAVLDQGRLQALGSHEALMAASPLYARLAALQFADGGDAGA